MLKGYCMQINEKNNHKLNAQYLDKCVKLIQNIVPDDISYNTLIDACARAENIDSALGYFIEMKKKNIAPDIITYSTLIKGIKNLQAAQRREQRKVLFRSKKILNQNVSLEKVLELYKQAKQEPNMELDERFYNSVLEACIEFDNLVQANIIYKEMITKEIEPSKFTYKILIKGYGLARDF